MYTDIHVSKGEPIKEIKKMYSNVIMIQLRDEYLEERKKSLTVDAQNSPTGPTIEDNCDHMYIPPASAIRKKEMKDMKQKRRNRNELSVFQNIFIILARR